MSAGESFRGIRAVLYVVFLASVAVWWFVRAPAETAMPRVVLGIDAAGQARGLAAEVLATVRQMETIGPETPAEAISAQRQRAQALQASCLHLRENLPHAETTWIPVGESQALLARAAELAGEALASLPSHPVSVREAAAADVLATQPDQTGFTPENKAKLETLSAQLQAASDRLLSAVEQAAVAATLARGTLAGFEARDLLCAAALLACALGALSLWRAERRLQTPPGKAIEAELRLVARSDPREAVKSCYDHSAELLKLADVILAKANLSGGATHGRT